MTQELRPKLSICIGTYNRQDFIGATLDSIIAQAPNECEIVVSDNASTDNTAQVVLQYSRRFDRLRYFKQDANKGFDRNFDHAVERARGEYCWLFSDDDLMKPGAIERVLQALESGYDLVLINGECRDHSMSTTRVPNWFGIDADRVYGPGEMDCLFAEVGKCLMGICNAAIRRDLWLARDRERYYGSWFIHTGVILQRPFSGRTFLMAEPLLVFRMSRDDHKSYSAHMFDAWLVGWPTVVWSSALSQRTKEKFSHPEPWRRLIPLLTFRAEGHYSWEEFGRSVRPRLRSFSEGLVPGFVAMLPRGLARPVLDVVSAISGDQKTQAETDFLIPESWKVLQKRMNRRVESKAI